MHPNVTLEISNPNGVLMRSRLEAPAQWRHSQEVQDVILASISDLSADKPEPDCEQYSVTLRAWSSIMHEVEDILQELPHGNSLSEAKDLVLIVKNSQSMLEEQHLSFKSQRNGDHTHRSPYTRTSAASLMASLTLDILVLVEMARCWPNEASAIFLRLLGTVDSVPESRLAIVVYGLKEISVR